MNTFESFRTLYKELKNVRSFPEHRSRMRTAAIPDDDRVLLRSTTGEYSTIGTLLPLAFIPFFSAEPI